MDGGTSGFLDALDARATAVADACTACGKCVEVCPTTTHAGIDTSDPRGIAAGVIDLLRGGAGTAAAKHWASVCTNSGFCIPACDYGVNPRFMLGLARRAAKAASADEATRRGAGVAAYRKMSRGVRVLSRLQLPPDVLARLGQGSEADDPEDPDLVFYTGCNVLKTPHIALLALDVMDAMGVSYRVVGGPAACCGVLHFKGGDTKTSGRVASKTIERLGASKTAEVLSWCPTCQIQLGEFAIPTAADAGAAAGFDLAPYVLWLSRNLDRLRPHLVHPVRRRVGLHEHPGVAGVAGAARRILEAIPGLTFVDVQQPQIGHMCSALEVMPAMKRDVHAATLEAARAAGVDTLAGVYHACHRELCSHERDWPFSVVNFLELVGESMGLSREDQFKRLKLMGDVEAIMADAADLVDARGLDPAEVREVVLTELLGAR